MDANFRLKRRNVSCDDKDPSYSVGWAYFVPEVAYKAHLTKYDSEIVQSVSIGVLEFVFSNFMIF